MTKSFNANQQRDVFININYIGNEYGFRFISISFIIHSETYADKYS